MGVSQKNFFSIIVGIGILSGIARVLLDYLAKLLEVSPIIYYLTFFIAFVIEIIIVIYAIKKYKKAKGNLTIVDALKGGIVIMGIIGVFYCSMSYIYNIYIDPDFQTNMTLRFTEQFSPDQLERVQENINNQDTSKSYIGVIMYTIWFIFLGSVISLITGAALKTKEEIK